MQSTLELSENEGILLIDKPVGKTSFSIVHAVRKCLQKKKVGHGGTLDPFATGLLIIFVGKRYTKMADQFLNHDKEYSARLKLGEQTDTFDLEGQKIAYSRYVPTTDEIKAVIDEFQGTIEQIPPMFSAKKIQGTRLYELARKGQVVARAPSIVTVEITYQNYEYPYVDLYVRCTKGTYIRSLADDIGKALGTFAHLVELRRTKSGNFSIDDAITYEDLHSDDKKWKNALISEVSCISS